MANNPNVRGIRLTIPSKDKPAQRNNLDTIERWANSQVVNQLVAGSGVTITNQPISSGTGNVGTGVVTINASGGSGGYASLTGAGETTTPGDLTQQGGFTVVDNGDGIDLDVSGANPLQLNATSSGGIEILQTGSGVIQIETANGIIQIIASSTLDLQGIGGAISSTGAGLKVLTNSAGKLGFYNVTPVVRAAHPVTLSDVITLLTNLGLCS